MHRQCKGGIGPVVESPGQHGPVAPERPWPTRISAGDGSGARAPPHPRCRPERGSSRAGGRSPRSPPVRTAPAPGNSTAGLQGTCPPHRRCRASSIRCSSSRRPLPMPACRLGQGEIEQVRLTGCHGHDAVADDLATVLQDEAGVARQQAVAEDAGTPGKLVGALFDGRDHRHIRLPHFANGGRYGPEFSAHRLAGARRQVDPPGRTVAAGEAEVVPGLALLSRAAQQVGRVIGDDERNGGRPVADAPDPAGGRSACRSWSRFCAAMRPTARIRPGCTRAICRWRYPSQLADSSGFGSRLSGGRHLRILAM